MESEQPNIEGTIEIPLGLVSYRELYLIDILFILKLWYHSLSMN